MRLVGLLLPFQHEPHHQRGEHRREGVDLALHGREPEGVGECVGQGSDGARSQHGDGVDEGHFAPRGGEYAACDVRYGPKQEQYAERTRQTVHGVDHVGHIVRRGGEHGGDAGHEHEKRRPGRVPHLQFVRCGDELGAVPKTRRRLHRQQICQGRHGEYRPTRDSVPAFEIHKRYVAM